MTQVLGPVLFSDLIESPYTSASMHQTYPELKPQLARSSQSRQGFVPAHLALIMDGNRRWAKKRLMPAAMGHARGAARVRDVVKTCIELGIPNVSLFAFSTENWRRPPEEVNALMKLFMTYLEREIDNLQASGVRLLVVGDQAPFHEHLKKLIGKAHTLTAANRRLTLMVCVNYGGRSDVLRAVSAWQAAHPGQTLQNADEQSLARYLGTGDAPEVDLLVRTGGESRVSNFLLWQAAYAELYFTDILWPDFDPQSLRDAVAWFIGRDRRLGGLASDSPVLDPRGASNNRSVP